MNGTNSVRCPIPSYLYSLSLAFVLTTIVEPTLRDRDTFLFSLRLPSPLPSLTQPHLADPSSFFPFPGGHRRFSSFSNFHSHRFSRLSPSSILFLKVYKLNGHVMNAFNPPKVISSRGEGENRSATEGNGSSAKREGVERRRAAERGGGEGELSWKVEVSLSLLGDTRSTKVVEMAQRETQEKGTVIEPIARRLGDALERGIGGRYDRFPTLSTSLSLAIFIRRIKRTGSLHFS